MSKPKFSSEFFLLMFISFFFIVTNVIWLWLDCRPPSWDPAGHMLLSLRYFKLMSSDQWPSFVEQLYDISHYYPPFFYLSSLPWLALFGVSEHSLYFVNFFYVFLLVGSMYGIGKILFDKSTGVLASAMVLLYPIMYALSREHMIDFALVAVVTTVQYFILKSEGNVKWSWHVGLGGVVALALLTKTSSVIFFLPNLLVVFFLWIRQKKDWRSFGAFFSAVILIGGPWYFLFFSDVLKNSKVYNDIAMAIEGDPVAFIPSLLWYMGVIRTTMLSPVLFIFFCLGLVCFLLFDRRPKVWIYLFLWAVPALVVLAVYFNKDGRYLMPMLPVVALVTIGGIRTLRNSYLRRACYGGVLLSGILFFIQFSFARIPFFKNIAMPYYNSYPSAEDWKIRTILEAAPECAGKKAPRLCVLPDAEHFNPNDFLFYAELMGKSYPIRGLGYEGVSDQLQYCDLLLITDPLLSAEWTISQRKEFQEEFIRGEGEAFGFIKKKEFGLPDNVRAILYKNINSQPSN